MIDTIHINLHNLQHNYDVYNWIVRDGRDGVVKYEYDRREQGGLLQREVKIYPESDKAVETMRIHNRYQPSSHYSVIVKVDQKRDLISFAFSVPKYFYGHNLAQGCENVNERDFKHIKGLTDTFDYQIKQSYKRIKTYIKSFFWTEFAGVDIDWRHVEITRIDMCYNQFFQTKQDALFYLDMQKKIQKKHFRLDSQKMTNYETSIFFASRDYSVKIYHKGSEYAKNDAKQHMRANADYQRRHGKNLFDVEYLQDTADRILRYEITFRKDYMSYLFNTRIFRKNSKKFKSMKELYNKLHSLNTMEKREQKNLLIKGEAPKVETLEHKQMEFFAKQNRKQYDRIKPIVDEFKNVSYGLTANKEKINLIEQIVRYYRKKEVGKITDYMIVSSLNRFYEDFSGLLSKPRKIFLQLDEVDKAEYEHDNKTNVNFLKTVDYIPFSSDLCIELGTFLKNFCNDFKVNQRDNLGTMLRRIREHNDMVDAKKAQAKNYLSKQDFQGFKTKKKIDPNRMGFILLALENHPMHELKKILDLGDKAFSRLKKDLELLGISKNTLNSIVPIVTRLDFSDYWLETEFNSKKFFINNSSTRLFSSNDYKMLQLL